MTTTPSVLDWPECPPVWDEPIAEGLLGISSSVACKAIATCAVLAWNRGESTARRRDGLIRNHHSEVDLRVISQAQECTRSSGPWPWNH
jgi:hypothetical protein